MSETKKIFQQRLKAVRTERGFSQDVLAQKAGVLRAAFNHWENGKREPDITALCALADALDVSLDYLVGRTDDPTRR